MLSFYVGLTALIVWTAASFALGYWKGRRDTYDAAALVATKHIAEADHQFKKDRRLMQLPTSREGVIQLGTPGHGVRTGQMPMRIVRHEDSK